LFDVRCSDVRSMFDVRCSMFDRKRKRRFLLSMDDQRLTLNGQRLYQFIQHYSCA
jgi:hypothetical protein